METEKILQMNRPKLNTGFFFLCLGLIITLITTVVSFLNLVFGTLNKRFPDVLNANYQYGYSTYDYEGMRMALATLIIFFPVFLIISYFWDKYTKGHMGLWDKALRKWLIYGILFISAVVVMGDLVALIKYFIAGEITTRFILKVVVTLVVALTVGKFYIFQLLDNKVFGFKFRSGWIASIFSTILVVGAVVYSFMIMGSPMKQRDLRLDDRRVNDLQTIQYQVINYWQQKEELPKDLATLASPLTGFSLPVDPEFEKGNTYEYSIIDDLKFELCASFALPMPKGWREYGDGRVYPMMAYEGKDIAVSSSYPYPDGGMNESWDHMAGMTCFERTIDPDFYPPYPKPL